MSPSSTSHSTNSELVAHRLEDEQAGPSSKHSTIEDFFVGTEDAYVKPDPSVLVEEDPLRIRSSDEDEEPIRYFVFCVCFQFISFLVYFYILLKSVKEDAPP